MVVEFNEGDNVRRPAYYSQTPKSKISNWLIAKGLAKDDSEANKIQAGVAIFFIIIAVFIFLR